MSNVIAFPRRSPVRALCRASDGSAPFSTAWLTEHAPLAEAGLQLLACDDAEFGRRCRSMADEDGRQMLGELSLQLKRLGSHVADIADSLSLVAERIRDGMTALA